MTLTDKEKEVFDYISERFTTEGYSPSVRDIQKAVGFGSTATVYAYIEKLVTKGYLKKDNNKSRSLRPVTFSPVYSVPIIGRVTAGLPVYAFEENDGFINFVSDGKKYKPDSLFALKVSGFSMKNAGILDGDTVIVEKTSVADDGQIIVAMIDDEATVKRFYKEDGKFRLQPENDDFAPIYTDSVTVLGKVIASVRYY